VRESVTQSTCVRASPAAGFCLVENLAALAIVMLTVLGTARQFGEALRMMRDNTDTRNAVMLGEDLVDRIAANASSLPSGTSFKCRVGKARCFADAFIESEIAAWHRELRRELPAAHADIAVAEMQATRTLAVSIEWQNRRRQLSSQEFDIVLHK
jgi:Tfp pilus assembly protein PilV